MDKSLHLYTYTCIYVCIFKYMNFEYIYMYIHVCTYRIYIHVYKRERRSFSHTHPLAGTHTHTNKSFLTDRLIHIHIYTHTHTYIHQTHTTHWRINTFKNSFWYTQPTPYTLTHLVGKCTHTSIHTNTHAHGTHTLPNYTSVLQKHILIPILLLCLRLLTSHSPSTTFIPLLSTTTFGTHLTNSTLTPSSTLFPTWPSCNKNVANVPTAAYYALLLHPLAHGTSQPSPSAPAPQ